MPQDENSDVYRNLVRSGVHVEDADGRAKFTSPAAAGYINCLLFPHRSTKKIYDIARDSMFVLMKAVVARISDTMLKVGF